MSPHEVIAAAIAKQTIALKIEFLKTRICMMKLTTKYTSRYCSKIMPILETELKKLEQEYND